jgi:hypothetical protein
MPPVLLLGYVMPKLRSQAVEAGLIADVDTVEENVLGLQVRPERLQNGRFDPAGRAGGVPEIQDDHLSGPVPGVSDRPVIQCAFQNYRRLPLGLAQPVTDPSPAM